ncbi:hypothetical protein [Curtobacterium sp. PhB25]|uniref:hypothetical protein n=1 Tax=Curtobacterium sp. PhB25 TaxID=2485205 RepID=UPI0010654BF5|nr:hypothetical protein [Curtobacterium sp. PhB25]
MAAFERSELQHTPWWARADLRTARAAVLEADDAVREAADDAAASILHTEFCQLRDSAARNPYHPNIAADIDSWAERTVTAARTVEIDTRDGLDVTSWLDFPELAERLTVDAARSLIRRGVTELTRIVESDAFLLRWGTFDGEEVVDVQHQASRLRARFTRLGGERAGFGMIMSKPYNLGSVDPDDPHQHDHPDWRKFVGAGIGRKLYFAGASLMPELRWESHTVAPQATALRRRLHSADPYRWAAHCDWCDAHDVYWRDAPPTTFASHPRTELHVPVPTFITPETLGTASGNPLRGENC